MAPGQWKAWTYGNSINGWTLECGAIFAADVRQVGGGRFYASINRQPLTNTETVEEAQRIAEQEIVTRVRAMLPAYREIYARAIASDGITPTRPR